MVVRIAIPFELENSNSRISLQCLFDGEEEVADVAPLDIEGIARVLCRGGWPAAIIAGVTLVPGRLTRIYAERLTDSSVTRMDDVSWNSTRMHVLTRAYARHVSTQASQTVIAADLAVNDGAMAPNTVSDYLDTLPRAYVVEDLPARNSTLRFKAMIRMSPIRHFVDPSTGIAVMRWAPAGLLRDFEAFGLQFESLCVRDPRVCAEAIDGTLLHYRDKIGLEVDAVIIPADGRWAPTEVKLGSRQFDEAAAHLRLLRERVNVNRMGKPSFLAVVTAGTTAYRRDDGVLVVPLACLHP